MIAGFIALAALALVLHDRRARQSTPNPVTRTSRRKRLARTWDRAAHDSVTAGDNDRTVYFRPVGRN